MAKDKITEYDATANNNTVCGDVNIAENSALPSDMNNFAREIMSHLKEGLGSGTPLYVDQTNNRVGIGVSPSHQLHVQASGNGKVRFEGNLNSNTSDLLISHNSSGDSGLQFNSNQLNMFTYGDIAFYAGTGNISGGYPANERMRIDSSGNLLVGTTNDSPASGNYVGISLKSNGQIQNTVDGGIVANFNRKTSDGDILRFRKDGAIVGNIGSANSVVTYYIIDPRGSGVGITATTTAIYPCTNGGVAADNVYDWGFSSVRWDDIYATNGTIQTSDRNEKQDIEELSEAEQRVAVVAKGLMRKFRWKDKVAEKGDNARTHFGIIAQDLQDAFTAEGLDAGDYAMFTSNTWWELDGETYNTEEEAPEGATQKTRLGVRYNQLLAFIISAI